jgi:hypothetical protein
MTNGLLYGVCISRRNWRGGTSESNALQFAG